MRIKLQHLAWVLAFVIALGVLFAGPVLALRAQRGIECVDRVVALPGHGCLEPVP
jgi:hypothetical protein